MKYRNFDWLCGGDSSVSLFPDIKEKIQIVIQNIAKTVHQNNTPIRGLLCYDRRQRLRVEHT